MQRVTVYIIVSAARKGTIAPREAKELLAHLVSTGFRLAPEVFAQATKNIDDILA